MRIEYEYAVPSRTSRAEARAMLNGLSTTGQLEAASQILPLYLAQPPFTSSGAPGEGEQQSEAERLAAIVLNGCAEEGRMDLSGKVLTAMREQRVTPTALTFCILFKGYGRAGDLARVRKLRSAMAARSVAFDLPTFNTLLDAFASHGDLASAEGTLAQMLKQGIAPSVRSYNILIKGYAQHKRTKDAFEVALRMRTALGPNAANEVTYSTLIHACVRNNELRRARQLMTFLAEGDGALRPDVYCYTALMRGLLTPPQPPTTSSNGAAIRAKRIKPPINPRFAPMYACRVEEALKLLDEMLAAKVMPNDVCVSTIVGGCLEHANNATAAKIAADAIRAHGVAIGEPSLPLAVDAALIVGYCRPSQRPEPPVGREERQRLKEALRLFAEHTSGTARHPAEQRLLDVRTCNALVAALISFGEMPSAVRVVAAMDAGAAEAPNAYTLAILMRGHGAARQLRQARAVWGQLCEAGWVDTVGLNAWLATCLACREEREALQAFQTVKSQLPNVPLDRVTFATLIHGLCGGTASKASAERAVQLWAEMRGRGLQADIGVVRALFAACHQFLDVEVALRLRVELLAMGWSEGQLREFSQQMLQRLPPLTDVLADPERWSALGVCLPPDIVSEQSQLMLMPYDGAKADAIAARAAAAAFDADSTKKAFHTPYSTAAKPASVAQEIFERKGWNEMDGSGWKPWLPW